jgi:WS/DGAT/MGAT family acyltransferase
MVNTVLDDAVLVPGAVRLRPDDHFMVLMDTDTSPMTIGALLLFDIAAEQRGRFADTISDHFIARLNHTALPVRLVQSPDGYDSDVWADIGEDQAAQHVMVVEQEAEWSVEQLYTWASQRSLERLDLAAAAFCIDIIPSVANGQAAIYIRMHHSVADGVGFQTVLCLLSDQSHPFGGARPAAVLPDNEQWRRLAEARFVTLEAKSLAHRASQQTALSELKALKSDPTSARARTPALAVDLTSQARRSYATISLPLARIKAVAAKLNGTVNDIFITMASGAIRQLLIEREALPETPIVANSARSYRRPEHGFFGNRIVALHPHLATHLPDPLERLQAIQSAMAVEWRRTHFDEAMLDQPERPYGARDRRSKFAERATQGGVALPGNVSLSNVPGPADVLSFGAFALRANYPVPIIGNGRVLNITSRRNAERLDIGIMGLPSLIPDANKMCDLLLVSLDELEQL